MFHYGKQHNDNDQNKNNEGETSVQLNLSKRWSRSQRFYHGDTGKEKDKNALGEGSDEIKETRKRRLNWGEGLAKFEKKKREVEGVSATSAVASTPTSVACSSLSGMLLDSLCCFFCQISFLIDVNYTYRNTTQKKKKMYQVFLDTHRNSDYNRKKGYC